MTTSNLSTWLHIAASAVCLFSLPSLRADTVKLYNGDALTGTIKSFDQGVVTLDSPMTRSPLEFNVAAIKQIIFSKKSSNIPTHTESLTLSNNDIIPCRVLSMDKKHLYISTWYAGKFTVPRHGIKNLQFGISEEKTIFNATKDPNHWTAHKGNWTHSGTTYTSLGMGMLAEKINLPENVRFQFDLSWKDNPNFAFRFCAENTAASTKQNTYEFLFNSAGMQLSRYESSSQPAAPLANIAIKPRSLPNQKIHVDLRVNRKEGLISLFIDNNLVGTWPDPFPSPKGNHFILINRSSTRKSCIISRFKVQSISGSTLPRHREKSAPTDTDILVDSVGEKYSGTIISIGKGAPNNRKITMSVKHSDTPLRIPDRRVSTLFFAQTDDTPDYPNPTFIAILKNNGRIRLENPKLINGKLISHHPILGSFSIDTKALSHIELPSSKPHPQKNR